MTPTQHSNKILNFIIFCFAICSYQIGYSQIHEVRNNRANDDYSEALAFDSPSSGKADFRLAKNVLLTVPTNLDNLWRSYPFSNDSYNINSTSSGKTTDSPRNTLLVDLGSDTALCAGATLILDAGNPGLNYLWSPDLQTSQTITVSTPGTYSVIVSDNTGCTGTDEINVSFSGEITAVIDPINTLTITCDIPTIILDGTASEIIGGNPIFSWEASDGGNIISATDESTAEIDSAGTYLLIVSNTVGCKDSTSIEIFSDIDLPIVDILLPGQLTCVDTIIQLDATGSSNGPDFETQWAGGMLNGLTTLTPEVSETGVYILTISDTTNGCIASQSVTVLTAVEEISLNTSPITYLDCSSDSTVLYAFVFPDGPLYEFHWTALDSLATIVNGENEMAATVNGTGIYQVDVINPDNGCTASTAGSVLPNPDIQKTAWLSASFPICFGDLNGSIQVDSVLGGTEPYSYSFDNNPFTTDTFNNTLGAGEHLITVKDSFGCLWDTLVVLPDGNLMLVDLEEPYGFVELGDSVRIIAVPSEPIDVITWQSPYLLSCDDCFGPWVHPVDSFTISVEVVNSKGCRAEDEIVVLMEKIRKVYIPNAFSPNGNRRNEWFNVYTGKAVKTINYLRIYTRWGGTIYEDFNLPLGDVKHGWDGNFANGEPALPGVYIYMVEVEYLDGVVERFHGELTLFR